MPNKKVEISKDDISQLIDNARFLKKQDARQALEFLERALVFSKESKFTSGVANCYKELGSIHFQEKNYKESLTSYLEAIANFEKLSEQQPIKNCYDELSDIYFKVGEYEMALEKQLKALACSKQLADKAETAHAYNKIGEIYKFHTEYRKAIEQHFNALKIFEETGDKRHLSNTNFYIGNCYNWVNEYDVARNYLEKSLAWAEELGDPQLKVKPMGSLAILNTKQKNYDKSHDFFRRAIENVDIIGNKFIKSDLLKSLGKLYIETNDYDKAISTLNEALQISEELHVKFPANIIHLFLSEVYEKKGDHEKSLEHFKTSTSINKEISNEEITLKAAGIQLKFDLDEMRMEKEIAEKSVKLKDQFLSNVSHEIRTPLNGILGMTNLLSDTHPSAEQLEYINTIKLSANNLLVILNDLFDYTKINSGKIKFDHQQFKIKEVLTNVVQMMKVKADEKKLQLSLIYDEHTPDLLVGDPMRLNQILHNLLNNAVKFTEKGWVTLEMKTLSQTAQEIKLLFTISDTGSGIEEGRLPKIFETFTQTKINDDRSQSGTGLGLTIVKHLVEQQGGSISVNSTLDSGSIFKIELKFLLPEKSVSKNVIPGKSAFHPQDLSLISLLLVEDNKVNQFLAKQLLTKMGFGVEIAGGGKQALEILQKKNFDVILMDVQMPGMTGYELCEHIRKQLEDPVNRIPIIALTAYASNQEKDRAISAGMNDYITKPYSPQELLSVILKYVGHKADRVSLKIEPVNIDAPESVMMKTIFSVIGNNKEDAANLIEMFLLQVPSINNTLEKSISEKNWEAAFQAAHKVKSSLKLLKIEKLSESITTLEERTRAKSGTETIPELFKTYLKQCNECLEVLRDELKNLKNPKN
ncbi:MAG: tetratricopeptide repeat protein [Bacteroidota bacterium]